MKNATREFLVPRSSRSRTFFHSLIPRGIDSITPWILEVLAKSPRGSQKLAILVLSLRVYAMISKMAKERISMYAETIQGRKLFKGGNYSWNTIEYVSNSILPRVETICIRTLFHRTVVQSYNSMAKFRPSSHLLPMTAKVMSSFSNQMS